MPGNNVTERMQANRTDGAVLGDTDWEDVASDGTHVCATKSGGELYCWGRGAEGQLGFGDAFTPVLIRVAGQ